MNAALVFLILIICFPFTRSEHTIECYCTTFNCRMQNVTTCLSRNNCYTQWTRRKKEPLGFIQGCINPGNPSLLCMNQKPLIKISSWPVLHCCSVPFCNNGSAETIHPALLLKEESEEILEKPPVHTSQKIIEEEDEIPLDPDVLKHLGVNSMEELKEKLRSWKSKDPVGGLQLLIIWIGLCIAAIISACGFYFVLKYKIMYEANQLAVEKCRNRNEERHVMENETLIMT